MIALAAMANEANISRQFVEDKERPGIIRKHAQCTTENPMSMVLWVANSPEEVMRGIFDCVVSRRD